MARKGKLLVVDDEQVAGGDHGRDEGEQRREAMAQHEIDAAGIAVRHRDEAFFAQVIEPPCFSSSWLLR